MANFFSQHWLLIVIIVVAIIAGGIIWYFYSSSSPAATATPTTTVSTTGTTKATAGIKTAATAPAATSFTVASGALPQTDNDAQLVLLDPNATAAQIDAATTIETNMSLYGTATAPAEFS